MRQPARPPLPSPNPWAGSSCRRRRPLTGSRTLAQPVAAVPLAPVEARKTTVWETVTKPGHQANCWRHRQTLPGKDQHMRVTQKVKKILDWYEGDPPGVKANLARILCTGKLGGTGKVVILPVDQGFEHGPARSFAPNPPAYDPHYHYQLAIEAGLNAYAAPLGMIAQGADTFAGQIPTILKCNNSNSLETNKAQAVTARAK